MAAITRWVQYDVAETGVAGTGGSTNYGRGTRGYHSASPSVGDSFSLGTTNNRLYVNIDGDGVEFVVLASGTDLDPRFVAKDITEKIHNLFTETPVGWTQSQCVWEDGALKLYSGTLGINSQVAVSSGTNSANLELGWTGVISPVGGLVTANNLAGNYITVSGVYNGFFDEIYHIVISDGIKIGTPTKDGDNHYGGVFNTGGVFSYPTSITYELSISDAKGTTMGAGIINAPTVSWTSTAAVDDGGPLDLLYADYWYKIGSKGLMVKFSDGIFNTCDPAWTIICAGTTLANGAANSPVGTAKFVWSSSRGDDAIASSTTSDVSFVELGSRGVSVKWTAPGNLTARDEFFVICTPPQPSSWGITNLNYGNVTVSTESPVRTVMFEILSGAVLIDTVKFGLQSHGNFEHHGEGVGDTYFRFGTVGPGNNAQADGGEWWPNVTGSPDMSDLTDIAPSWLYSIKHNLSVVADADSSEAIGVSTYAGMVADPIWLNIKLGTSEVGANSTINYRVYFDYS